VKLDVIGDVLRVYAAALDGTGAGEAAWALRLICDFTSDYSKATVAELVSQVRLLDGTHPSASDGRIRAQLDLTLSALRHLNRLLTSAKASSAVRNDIEQFIDLLATHGDSGDLVLVLTRLRTAMNHVQADPRVEAFAKKLKQETGSADFERTFAELKASPLTRQEVVEIAGYVYGHIKKSTSRIAALSYIRKPHDAYLSTKRGIDATGGRSAA
jgi:hypothetical protein